MCVIFRKRAGHLVDSARDIIISLAFFFFFQAEDGIRDLTVTGVQTCALPISVTATFSVLRRYKPLSLTASLPGCLALALGIFLFLAKGVRDVLRLPGD